MKTAPSLSNIMLISNERAIKMCARALLGDDEIVLKMLNEQKAEAFIVDGCCFITRFETNNDNSKKELVVMCAEGKNLLSAGRFLKEIAKKHGCTSARMHTKRPAIARLVRELGWVQDEIIFKMPL
jgi:hypothetical protein